MSGGARRRSRRPRPARRTRAPRRRAGRGDRPVVQHDDLVAGAQRAAEQLLQQHDGQSPLGQLGRCARRPRRPAPGRARARARRDEHVRVRPSARGRWPGSAARRRTAAPAGSDSRVAQPLRAASRRSRPAGRAAARPCTPSAYAATSRFSRSVSVLNSARPSGTRLLRTVRPSISPVSRCRPRARASRAGCGRACSCRRRSRRPPPAPSPARTVQVHARAARRPRRSGGSIPLQADAAALAARRDGARLRALVGAEVGGADRAVLQHGRRAPPRRSAGRSRTRPPGRTRRTGRRARGRSRSWRRPRRAAGGSAAASRARSVDVQAAERLVEDQQRRAPRPPHAPGRAASAARTAAPAAAGRRRRRGRPGRAAPSASPRRDAGQRPVRAQHVLQRRSARRTSRRAGTSGRCPARAARWRGGRAARCRGSQRIPSPPAAGRARRATFTSVVLPAPLGPMIASDLARPHRQRDVVSAVSPPKRTETIVELEQRRGVRCRFAHGFAHRFDGVRRRLCRGTGRASGELHEPVQPGPAQQEPAQRVEPGTTPPGRNSSAATARTPCTTGCWHEADLVGERRRPGQVRAARPAPRRRCRPRPARTPRRARCPAAARTGPG